MALDIGNDLGVAVPMTTDNGDNQPVFRQYRSGEGAFLASKPHNRLLETTPENASSYLDFLTVDALPAGADHTDWALEEAARVREAIPGGRLLQRWIGEVTAVTDGSFTANYVTTLDGEDTERATFRAEATLSESDQEKLKVGAVVEWLVYESVGTRSPVRSRMFRIAQPAAATRQAASAD